MSQKDSGDSGEPALALFRRHCVGCHGPVGGGAVGPALRGRRLSEAYVLSRLLERRPGSMMPEFAGQLKSKELQQLAAYISRWGDETSGRGASRLPLPNTAPRVEIIGNSESGRDLFFRSENVHRCSGCHTFDGMGGKVGPDLAIRARHLSPKQVAAKILNPRQSAPSSATGVQVRTRGGLLLRGVIASDTTEYVRLYETSYLPPRSMAIPVRDVLEVSALGEPIMPGDYASRLTVQQLLDIVAFVKSASAPKSSIRWRDLH
ncbi:MAG: c-type cytochrome [Vicinamibacterales bacterium]